MSMLVSQQVLLPRLPMVGRWVATPLAWALLATERGPPLVAATWPRNASLPLTDAKPRPD